MGEIINGVFRHYKNGKKYQITGVAVHTENNEKLVIYKPLYESECEFYARPYEMFFEQVSLNGENVNRFEKVEEKK